MWRVQTEPEATVRFPAYGAPPPRMAPSLQESVQPISPPLLPPLTVTALVTKAPGECGGDGGDDNITTKVSVPKLPAASVIDCSSPSQIAPFHPSPYESVMLRVHVEPVATFTLPVNGLPPDTAVPSLHESVQPTSPEYMPPLTSMVADASKDDGDEAAG